MTLSKSIMMSLAAAVVALLVVQAPAAAVTALRVNVPFDFVANGKVRAAGVYMVRTEPMQGLLNFSDDTGNGFSVFTTNTGARNISMKSFLEFKRTGSEHVLSAVYMPGFENGFQLPGTGKLKGDTYRLAIQQ